MSHTYAHAHNTALTPAHDTKKAPAPAHDTAQSPAHAHTTAQAPAPAHNTAQAPTPAHNTAQAPTPTDRGSTCVTCKWSMPLDIRPFHAFPLCACGTPMHPLHCVVGSNHVTPSC
ncbi:hypothetical protein O181_046399 [Austropuccinia psidii MF-1]|uniref:Uncharacterized protein n=1 Tax=Austropuccinia psidii MF-1 TaxID=1389203 RepID=A0A9Q3DP08_9BASI|nr:hypothetical protein [Austropuccinia psidii MF-1]